MLARIWDAHEVVPETPDTPAVLYIDLHLVHEVTTPQAFDVLRANGLPVRRPDRTLATMDHSTPTEPASTLEELDRVALPAAAGQVRAMIENCEEFGVELRGLDSPERGIVHVVGPEQGATWPGHTVVCGDSHTSTHGAFGALAFGIGTTEVGHVLATQCLLQRRPGTLAVNVSGRLGPGVTAKDLVLAIIRKLGVGGGIGRVLQYRGETIRALSMEQRMTVCNMSIEAGARAGMIAPDDTTYEWLHGRPMAPAGADWDAALSRWRELEDRGGAEFDREVDLDAGKLRPMVTYGTNPGMSAQIDEPVPGSGNPAIDKALAYMGVEPGRPLLGWLLSVLVALILSALVGMFLERVFVRPMVGEELFSLAVVTLGMNIILITVVTDLIGPDPRSMGDPWGDSVIDFGPAVVPQTEIAQVIVAVVLMVLVGLFFRTRTGIAMRATAFDQEAARAQGIKVGRIFAIAWAIGAVLATVGGIFGSVYPRRVGVFPDTALLAFRAFPAIILGGLDSVGGAVVGGLVVGLAEAAAGSYLNQPLFGTGFSGIVPYLLMMVVLFVRPYGIFGTEEVRRV